MNPNYPSFGNQSGLDVTPTEKIIESMQLQNSVNIANLHQIQNLHKEQYITNAKTCDGDNPNEISGWLNEVERLLTITKRDYSDIAIHLSTGALHKHVVELKDLK